MVVSILFVAYCLLFILSLWLKDNSIADVFWGIGFMILAGGSFCYSLREIPNYLLTGLILLWWLRISTHIGSRKWKEPKEDPRYAKWREEWGSWWYFYIRSFLQVYMLQMILMLVVALPIFVLNLWLWNMEHGLLRSSQRFDQIPIIVWAIFALLGLLFETIADYQLGEFIKIKKPWEIFTTGLYHYSRHPNYFGESVFWLGISLMGVSYSYFSLIWWGAITFLLLFVSGVPLQEARYAGRPNWEEYKKKTSVFIPWIPKK